MDDDDGEGTFLAGTVRDSIVILSVIIYAHVTSASGAEREERLLTRFENVFRFPTKTVSFCTKYAYSVWNVVRIEYSTTPTQTTGFDFSNSTL